MNDRFVDVLLVEDDPGDVELALHVFDKLQLGSRVHLARDGAEALEFLFSTGHFAGRPPGMPRLVLLDLKLPLIDGLEVLQQMKEDPRTRSIPVVVMTSSSEERDVVESYNLGVNSYVRKPVDFEQFAEIARALGKYWLEINRPPILNETEHQNVRPRSERYRQ